MTELFSTVLRMSGYGLVAALIASLAVLLLSRARCSKTALLLLFAVAALRLVCPWSPPSPLSLFNWSPLDLHAQDRGTALADSYVDSYKTVSSAAWNRDEFDRVVAAGVEPTYNQDVGLWVVRYHEDETGTITPAKTNQEVYGPILSALWLAGAAGFFLYGAVSYVLLKRRLRFAVKDEVIPGVWYSDRIPSPCVAGLFRPQIYLTFGLTESEKSYILAHERQHIKNGDHIWKMLAWLIMCVHWFNAFLWPLFYRAFLSQVEDACDQRVLRQLGEDKKADYGQVLLTLSAGRRFRLSPSPIAFGEGNTKGRVRTILRYKKPIAVISVLALIVAVIAGVCLLTGPDRTAEENNGPSTGSSSVQIGGAAKGYGTYQIYDLLYLTPLSSTESRSFLDERIRSAVVFTPERFYLEMEGLDVSDPIYQEIELGSQLILGPNGDEIATALDVSGESWGWNVLDAGGQETGFQVYLVDGLLWVARCADNGYWYLMEALPVGAGETLDMELVSWGVRLDDSGRSGWPFLFEGNFTRIDLQCDNGALTYDGLDTPGTDLTVVGTPPRTQVEWLPVTEGQPEPATHAAVTFTAWQGGEKALTGTIIIRQTGLVNGLTTYAAHAALSDTNRYFFWQNQGGADDEYAQIRDSQAYLMADPLATWSLDLTHDGVDERVSVYSAILGEPEAGIFYLLVMDEGGSILWIDQAATTHAGQNGLYLYEEDGQPYLLRWVPYGSSGWSSLSYQLFSLTEDGQEVILRENAVEYTMDDPMTVKVDALRALEGEIAALLPQCQVLLSTNEDTPDGVWYGDPENPISPSLFAGYYEDSPHWNYFSQLQAMAQGVYTFSGEVVDVMADSDAASAGTIPHIKVQDRTYFSSVAPYFTYVFTVPVDDPSQYQVGDTVSVTADDPLYRWDLPDESTYVSVALTRRP